MLLLNPGKRSSSKSESMCPTSRPGLSSPTAAEGQGRSLLQVGNSMQSVNSEPVLYQACSSRAMQ